MADGDGATTPDEVAKRLRVKLGVRLSVVLERAEMSQGELARRLGVDPATVNRYVAGKNEMSGSTMIRIVDILGCELGDLLNDEAVA